MAHTLNQLKRKLRQLRKVEIGIRYKHRQPPPVPNLVWDVFFSTHPGDQQSVKYPLHMLLGMDHLVFKEVVAEFFYHVYYQSYREKGLVLADVYDPQLLGLLGLSPYADADEIKKRFRELARKYHPDTGGDNEKFIELMDVYGKLTNR